MNNVNNEAELNHPDEQDILINNMLTGEAHHPNQNHNNPNNNSGSASSGMKSKEILEFSKDFFPSLFFIGLLTFSLSISNNNFCNQYYPVIIQSGIIFHFGFLFKSIFLVCFIFCFKSKSYLKYTIKAYNYVIYLAYYIFILYAYNLYKHIDNLDSCVHINPFHTIIIFGLIVLGIFDIFRHIFSFLLILIGFPVLVYHFFKDPREFIHRYGIDPELIDTWPTITAGPPHLIECVICSEDITESQQIMILNCHGRHFYHAKCIKEWLKVKLNCPVCRSNNVF